MPSNQYIENQLTKLRAQQEGKKKALDAQTKKWEKAAGVLRRGLLVARIVAAAGCALPLPMLLFGASSSGIGLVATIASALFAAALIVCAVFRLLSRRYEKTKSELANAHTETVDMIAVMESLMRAQAEDPAAAASVS
jgi:Flp pilus assembly protein TadB